MGARLRFRAVMMTSFAFILGLLPLVVAEGASEISRRAVGTPVFWGMLAASIIGIFMIPMLYVVFQGLREAIKSRLFARRPPRAVEHQLPGRASGERGRGMTWVPDRLRPVARKSAAHQPGTRSRSLYSSTFCQPGSGS